MTHLWEFKKYLKGLGYYLSEEESEPGEDYIIHPLNVAYILADLQLDDATICAALLHDVVEDTPYEFGKDASDYRLLKDEIIQDDIGTPKESVGKKR